MSGYDKEQEQNWGLCIPPSHPQTAYVWRSERPLESAKTYKPKSLTALTTEGVKVAPATPTAWGIPLAWQLPTANKVFVKGEEKRGSRKAGSCGSGSDGQGAAGHRCDSPVLRLAEPLVALATTGALMFCGKLCREHTGIASALLLFGRSLKQGKLLTTLRPF